MCSDHVGPVSQASLSGTRRVFQGWLVEAGDSLRKKRIADTDIHDARKLINKSRAALRLLRGGISETSYRRENSALRDAARPLGLARDSKVLIAVLDDLAERYAPAMQSLQLDKFRRVLRKERATARLIITAPLISKQRKVLREVAARSQRWRLHGDDWPVIGGGLERIYRSGRNKMRTAVRSRDDAELHDWRKQVKYLWHQLPIVAPLRPKQIEAAHKVADLLGDDHDLAVLRQKISTNAAVLEAKDRDALIAILGRRRKQLQSKAFKLGARIYKEKPGHWRLGNQ